MDCTEAYKEHIMYSFNGFCKVVIRYAAINAWRDRNRRRQREISFEYLTEEKFYPLSTSDEALKSPYEQYPVTICGQTIILTNGELAAALFFYARFAFPRLYSGRKYRRKVGESQAMQAGGKWRKPAQWNPSLSKSKILPQYQISLTAQFCPAGILLGLPPQARLLRLASLEKIHPRKEVHSHEKIQHAPPPPLWTRSPTL